MIDSIFLLALALSVPLGQLLRFAPVPGVNVYLIELIMTAHLLTLVVRYRSVRLLGKIFFIWSLYLVILLLITALQAQPSESIVAGLYLARALLLMAYLLITARLVLRIDIRWFLYLVPLIALAQFFFVPDLRFLLEYGWDPHMYRAVGMLFDPPLVACVTAVVFFYSLLRREYIPLALSYAALIFLYSRGAYISMIFCLIVYFTMRRQWINMILSISFTILCITLAPQIIPHYASLESAKLARTSTITSRHKEMMAGFSLWTKHPITGVGYNRVREYKALDEESSIAQLSHSASAFHSFWVTLLATTGIIGVILFGLLYVRLMSRSTLLLFTLLFAGIVGIFDNIILQPLFIATLVVLSSVYRENYDIVWRRLKLNYQTSKVKEESPSASTQD